MKSVKEETQLMERYTVEFSDITDKWKYMKSNDTSLSMAKPQCNIDCLRVQSLQSGLGSVIPLRTLALFQFHLIPWVLSQISIDVFLFFP